MKDGEITKISYKGEEYTKIESSIPKEEPMFKVGEYAKVVQRSHPNKGKIVKITKKDRGPSTPFVYVTELICGDGADVHKEEELQKVELSDSDLSFIRSGRNPGEFKKGDIVRVTDACGAPLSPGDLCEVKCDSTGMSVVHVTERGWAVSVDKLIAPADARVDGDE